MTTIYNGAFSEPLGADHLSRNDLVLRWGLTVSSFLAIPGLVGFWPFSSIARNTAEVYDLSGQGRTLARTGNVQARVYNEVVPYLEFDGSGDYYSRADEAGLDITGSETFYESPGLTMGGWFWNDGAGATDGLIGKWTESGNQRSYLLLVTSNKYTLSISSNGSSSTQFAHTSTVGAGVWHFAVGRFTPSTEMSVFYNGSQLQTTTSIPASIFNSTANFQIGAYNAGAQEFDGRAALCFLSANAVSNNLVNMLFQQSRVLFGI